MDSFIGYKKKYDEILEKMKDQRTLNEVSEELAEVIEALKKANIKDVKTNWQGDTITMKTKRGLIKLKVIK